VKVYVNVKEEHMKELSVNGFVELSETEIRDLNGGWQKIAVEAGKMVVGYAVGKAIDAALPTVKKVVKEVASVTTDLYKAVTTSNKTNQKSTWTTGVRG